MALIFPQTIKTQIKKNNLNHAYLFYGPGKKKEISFRFAEDILLQPRQKFPFLYEFIMLEREAGEEKIKIERVREMIRKISLRSPGRRVVLILGAELLSEEAANALLKTLEEPPKNTIFILTSSDIKEVLSTIVSRCQGFYLESKQKKRRQSGFKEKVEEFLQADLVGRFRLAENIGKDRQKGVNLLNGLEERLRLKMLKISSLKRKQNISREIKEINKLRLLLKRNISVRLVLEDLSLRLKRWRSF